MTDIIKECTTKPETQECTEPKTEQTRPEACESKPECEQTQTQTEFQKDNTLREEENWKAQFKRMFLASLGAVAFAEEELEKFIKKLIEKGVLAEQEGRKWLKEVMDKGYNQTKQTKQQLEHGMDNLDHVIAKISFPSKAEFNALSQKVEQLAARIEELSKKLP